MTLSRRMWSGFTIVSGSFNSDTNTEYSRWALNPGLHRGIKGLMTTKHSSTKNYCFSKFLLICVVVLETAC